MGVKTVLDRQNTMLDIPNPLNKIICNTAQGKNTSYKQKPATWNMNKIKKSSIWILPKSIYVQFSF